LAIDVGTSSVKLLLTNGKRFEKLHAFLTPFPSEGDSDGIIDSRDYLDSIWKGIREWLIEALPKGKKITKVGITSHIQSAFS